MERTYIITYHIPTEYKGTYVVKGENGFIASEKLEEWLRKTYGEFPNSSSSVMEMINNRIKNIDMNTILLKQNIPTSAGREILTHYEVVEYNGKKFLIYVEGSNGDYLGFNKKCCVKVMNESGVWENVVDNIQLGFSANNDKMYYSNNVEVKKSVLENNVKQLKDYILAVY